MNFDLATLQRNLIYTECAGFVIESGVRRSCYTVRCWLFYISSYVFVCICEYVCVFWSYASEYVDKWVVRREWGVGGINVWVVYRRENVQSKRKIDTEQNNRAALFRFSHLISKIVLYDAQHTHTNTHSHEEYCVYKCVNRIYGGIMNENEQMSIYKKYISSAFDVLLNFYSLFWYYVFV